MNRANLLSQIIFNAPNYIFWKDTHFIYRGCNLNFAKLAGVSTPEKIIGKTDDEMPWGHFTGHIYKEEDKQIMRTGMPILNKEVPLYLSENMQKMVLSVSKVPLFDDAKKIIGIMGIFIDTTDRILAEEREKAAILASAESKAEVEKQLRQAVMILTGSIVHDLRTPLLILESSSSFLGKNMPILIESYDKVTRHGLLEDTAPIHKAMKGHLLKIDQEIKKTVRDMHEFIDSTLQTLSKVISNDISQDDLTVCSMWHCIHNTLLRYPFTDEQRHLVE